jgi:hypothetical protein
MTDTTTPQPDADGWNTIDSAPKGKPIALRDDRYEWVGLLEKNGRKRGFCPPTHWKPLGPPPVGVE